MEGFEFELPMQEAGISEQDLENRGRLPSGWYRATVTDAYPNQKEGGSKIEYTISLGAYKGRQILDTLFDHTRSEDEKMAKDTLSRNLLVLKRLGCREENSQKCNLRLAMGKDVVIHLEHKKMPWCKNCNESPVRAAGDRSRKCPGCGGQLKWVEDTETFTNITFDGVYPITHPKIPAEVRAELQLPPPVEEGGDTVGVDAAQPARAATTPAARGGPSPASGTPGQGFPRGIPGPGAPTVPSSKEERRARALQGF